jgi:glycosyltransferase involved in cell wall biosynthesis
MPDPPTRGKVAYLLAQFPKLTETFLLAEMLAVEALGCPIAIYALRRGPRGPMHPEAAALLPRVHFHGWFSWPLLRAQAHYLRRRPRAYFGVLATLIRANWGSLRYVAGALVFFPQAVYFARHMQRAGVSRVHAHFASHPAAAAYVIKHLAGIPFSFTAHGSDLHRDRHMLREKVAAADLAVAISEYNRQCILEECGAACREKVAVIHCGVDVDRFPHSLRQKRPPGDVWRIVCIGTLHEVKGQRHLLEACRLLVQRGHRLTCHLLGEGPDRRRLVRQACRAGLELRVRFHGALPRPQLLELLDRADVLVAPSVASRDGRREGIPVAIMEAMACGVPVVASRLSGIPELVAHEVTGLLVPPGDAKALADALERIFASPAERCQMAAAARQKILEQFDARANAASLVQHFPTEAAR